MTKKKSKARDGFKFKAGDGFRLTFERIEQAKAKGYTDIPAIMAYLARDKELSEAVMEDHSRIIIAGARRYVRKMGLKKKDLTEEQMGEILMRLTEALFEEDD